MDQVCAPPAKTRAFGNIKLPDEDVTTCQKRPANYLTKMLQRIKNMWAVTWRMCYNVSWGFSTDTWPKKCKYQKDVREKTLKHCYNVSGPYCKYLEENATTHQERLANYLTKMLQRITNVLQDTWTICCNVSRTCLKLLDDDGTTYQEHLANYLANMLQRIRNVWQITWKTCYHVSRGSPKNTWNILLRIKKSYLKNRCNVSRTSCK